MADPTYRDQVVEAIQFKMMANILGQLDEEMIKGFISEALEKAVTDVLDSFEIRREISEMAKKIVTPLISRAADQYLATPETQEKIKTETKTKIDAAINAAAQELGERITSGMIHRR